MSIFSHTRRAAVIVSCGFAALSLTLLGSVAQAHTTGHSATPAARSAAASAPRHSASMVKDTHGRGLIHKAGTATIDNCPFGYFCVSSHQQLLGGPAWDAFLPNANITGSSYFWPWGQCDPTFDGCDAGVGSFINNSGQRVWLEQAKNSGNLQCIDSGAGSYTPDNTGNPDHLDFWILASGNPAAC